MLVFNTFGASYARVRRIKRVPMPRGAASEVACAGYLKSLFCGPVSFAPQRPPLPSVPVMPICAAFNAFRCPARRPLRWPVGGYQKCTYFLGFHCLNSSWEK